MKAHYLIDDIFGDFVVVAGEHDIPVGEGLCPMSVYCCFRSGQASGKVKQGLTLTT